MSAKQAAETIAHTATPVPIGVSGFVFMGVTVKDWVLIATAILLVFQLIVMAPKAYWSLCKGIRATQKAIQRIKHDRK